MSQAQQKTMFDALTCDSLDLIQHLGDDVEICARWPERLHTLFELHREYNLRAGMSETAAAIDARDRCILLGDYMGGRAYNLPRGDALRLAVRDKLIWLEARAGNYEQIASRHGLDVTHIYRIVRQQRALYKAKMQGRLFEG